MKRLISLGAALALFPKAAFAQGAVAATTAAAEPAVSGALDRAFGTMSGDMVQPPTHS